MIQFGPETFIRLDPTGFLHPLIHLELLLLEALDIGFREGQADLLCSRPVDDFGVSTGERHLGLDLPRGTLQSLTDRPAALGGGDLQPQLPSLCDLGLLGGLLGCPNRSLSLPPLGHPFSPSDGGPFKGRSRLDPSCHRDSL